MHPRQIFGSKPLTKTRRPVPYRPSVEVMEDRSQPSGLTGLGAAGTFGVLAINGGDLTLNSSHLVGDVGLGPNGTSVLQKTDVNGTFVADPDCAARSVELRGRLHRHRRRRLRVARPGPGRCQCRFRGLCGPAGNAVARHPHHFDHRIRERRHERTRRDLAGLQQPNANPLRGGQRCLCHQCVGRLHLRRQPDALAGGVTANHVVFNFPTAGPTIKLSKSTNAVSGTFLAPQRDLIYHNPAGFTGAVIADDIDIHSNGNLKPLRSARPIRRRPRACRASCTGTTTVTG